MSSNTRNWVWIRGLARSHYHWGNFEDSFRKTYPHDQIEFLDLPGNGKNSKLRSPAQISDYVATLREQSQWVSQGKKIHILALSLGAMVATSWAVQFPGEICELNLVTTSSKSTCYVFQRIQFSMWCQVLGAVAMQNVFEREKKILSMVSNRSETPLQYAKSFSEYAKLNPTTRSNFFRQLIAASRFDFPNTPPCATRLIGSHGDRFVHYQCTSNLGGRWKIEPIFHPTSGHDIPLDDPEWLARTLCYERV